jgi:putative peptidoglycan lipid II flippase
LLRSRRFSDWRWRFLAEGWFAMDGSGRYPAADPVSTHGADDVARNAGTVAGATLASRVLGLARDVVIGNLFAPGATDAFFIAFMIPNLFRRLVAEGSLTISFVPVFTEWLRRSREEARRAFDATWTAAALVGLAIALAGIAFADPLVHLFAPGFALEPGKHELAVTLLRLCFPYLFFLMLVAVAMGALNALGHFLAPAIAPVLLNLCLIAGASVGVATMELPSRIVALGWAVIVAGALQVAVQLGPLRRRGMPPRVALDPRHEALARIGRLMLPATLGASVFQLNVLISRVFASGLGDGAVSYLYYADRLLEFPLGVFVFAIGTASLPAFSRLAKGGDAGALRAAFGRSLLLALALALPSTAGLILLSGELFVGLFAWNTSVFGAEAVAGCARALEWYALGLVPITAARILTQLCVANENTASPARAAAVSVAVNLVAAAALIGPLPDGALPAPLLAAQRALVVADLGYAGLAAAASIASLANAVWIALEARGLYGALLAGPELGRALRLVGATAVMAVALLAALPFAPGGAIVRLTALVALGAAVYLGALAALGSPELRELAALARRRPGPERD